MTSSNLEWELLRWETVPTLRAHSVRPLCHIVFFKGERGLLIGGSLPHNMKDWKLFPTCKACESKRTEYCAKYEKSDKQ